MNIRAVLSSVSGSSEANIEYIERCIVKNKPFGLKCQRSMVVFIPQTFKAYWLWNDGTLGPTFQSLGVKEFVDTVKMQYLSHKEIATTPELLEISRLMQLQKQTENLNHSIHESIDNADPAGQLRILPGPKDL